MSHVDQRFSAEARERKAASLRAQYTPGGDRIIYLDGPIGPESNEFSARWLREQLPSDGSPVVLQIHSEGGSVFEAFSLLDTIKSYPGKIKAVVSSMALSAASLLLCGCDEIELTENSHVMLHSPHSGDETTDESDRALLASLSDRMIEIYAKRTRKPASEIRRAMESETWLSATEAVKFGLCDRIVDPAKRAAARSTRRVVAKATPKPSATARWNAAVAACGSVAAADRKNPGLRLRMLAEVNKR